LVSIINLFESKETNYRQAPTESELTDFPSFGSPTVATLMLDEGAWVAGGPERERVA